MAKSEMASKQLHYFGPTFLLSMALALICEGLQARAQETSVGHFSDERKAYSLSLRARTLLSELEIEDAILRAGAKLDSGVVPESGPKPENFDFSEFETEILKKVSEGEYPREAKIRPGHWAKELYREVRAEGRIYGTSAVIIYVAVEIAADVLPVFLYSVGQPGLATFLTVLPEGTITVVVFVPVSSLVSRKRNIRYYGGLENYRKFKSLRRDAKKQASLSHQDDLLLPLSSPHGEQNQVVRVASPAAIKRLLMKMRLSKKVLHFRAAVSIAKEEGVSPGVLKKIQDLGELSDSEKLALLFRYLENSGQQSVVEKISKEYSSRWLSREVLPQVNELPASVAGWVSKVSQVKDCAGFSDLVSTIPTDVLSPRQVEILWSGLVFPEVVRHYPKLKLRLFRAVRKETKPLWVKAEEAVGGHWDPAWTEALQASVKKHCR